MFTFSFGMSVTNARPKRTYGSAVDVTQRERSRHDDTHSPNSIWGRENNTNDKFSENIQYDVIMFEVPNRMHVMIG